MTTRTWMQEITLETLEADFAALLPPALERCAAGHAGLFGQKDVLDVGTWLLWPQPEQLREMAREIQALREECGPPNPLADRFLYYCSLRGAHVPAEPLLARTLLQEAGLAVA